MDIDSIFSPGGALDSALDSYSFREDQLEMSRLVEDAMEKGENAAIEAGTGIGKSFAYLAPVILRLMRDTSKRAVIATSTLTLEKQLYDKDIPLLLEALGVEMDSSILFGRTNYLCLWKYNAARSLFAENPESVEAEFDAWVSSTQSGASIDLPSSRLVPLFRENRCDENECHSYKCPFYERCFFYGSRRKAAKTQLIVTNHHLVLYDALYRDETETDFSDDAILPGYRFLIMDEAHHIEDEATDVLSSYYNSKDCLRTIDDLTKKQLRFGNMSLLSFLTPEENEKGIISRISSMLDGLRLLISDGDEVLSSVLSAHMEDEYLSSRAFYQESRSRIMKLEGLSSELRKAGMMIMGAFHDSPIDDQYAPFIMTARRYGERLAFFGETISTWCSFSDWDGMIPYTKRLNSGIYEIRISPMDTGAVLNRVLLSNLESTVFSSATLTSGGSFSFFFRRSGLDACERKTLSASYPSPFDFRKNLMLLIPTDGTGFSAENDAYAEYVAETVTAAISASGGGALVLFTSKKMLNAVYAKVLSRERNLELLVQSDDVSRAVLLRRFRENEDSSLFATSSFWEGVDAPGNTLRLVIIVKIPFTVPWDPVFKARSDYLERQGRSGFAELFLPDAIIRLKQGVGRLIRNEDDRGVVLLLDNRILSKSYGRMMVRSLPECFLPEDTTKDNIPDRIERFLY
ncbi:MAG: ATP-dependent DNA helicase [Candidatus Ornithospirochaeta sp.]|nr:ATP-dependent DNA helicase [Candidatus Ornithospirochaeta sp.]